MITKVRTVGNPRAEYYGLSSDAKPTDAINGDLFYEMDSKKIFLYDKENELWREQ